MERWGQRGPDQCVREARASGPGLREQITIEITSCLNRLAMKSAYCSDVLFKEKAANYS